MRTKATLRRAKPKAARTKAAARKTKLKAKPRIAKRAAPKALKAPKRKAAKAARPAKKALKTSKATKVFEPAMKKGQPKEIGRITHYFDHISVAVVELSSAIRQGDQIQIKGGTTDVTQRAASMQVNHLPVSVAQAGESIGLKVAGKVREGDRVFKLG